MSVHVILVAAVIARGRDDRFVVASVHKFIIIADLLAPWTPAIHPQSGFHLSHLQRDLTLLAVTLLQHAITSHSHLTTVPKVNKQPVWWTLPF